MQLTNEQPSSVEIVRKALPQMSKLGIPITPSNYAVWFEYTRASNNQLTSEMDQALNRGVMTTEVIDDLYRRYIRADDNDGKLGRQVRDDLATIISSFRDQLTHASGELVNYNQVLAEFSGHLSRNLSADELAAFVAGLAERTQDVVQYNATLQAGFTSAAAEVSQLQHQLEEHSDDAPKQGGLILQGRDSFVAEFESFTQRAFDDDTHGPCLVLIDIDQYPEIVDQYGHEQAQRVITLLSAIIKSKLGDNDLLSQFDDSLLAVVLLDRTASEAPVVAEQLLSVIAQGVKDEASEVAIATTASVGLAWLRKSETMDEWIERADAVLFLSQAGGQNRVTVDR